jgi:hypothetical protein
MKMAQKLSLFLMLKRVDFLKPKKYNNNTHRLLKLKKSIKSQSLKSLRRSS